MMTPGRRAVGSARLGRAADGAVVKSLLLDISVMANVMNKLQEVFHEHAAASFDKQRYLAALLGEDFAWDFDMTAGNLTIKTSSKIFCLPVQVLGTESYVSNTFLWSWANEASKIPSRLLQAAYTVRALGEKEGILEFGEPEVPAQVASGDYLCLAAAGICSGSAYFRGPYGNGAVFLLIRDPSINMQSDNPVKRITACFPELLSAVSLSDARRAFIAYLNFYGFKLSTEGNAVVGVHSTAGRVSARFDGLNRLTELAAEMFPTLG